MPEQRVDDALAVADAEPPRRRRENPSCTLTTSVGTFTIEIFLRQVPLTAANFIDLVERRFYDGTHVHVLAPGVALGLGCPHSRDPRSPRAGTGAAPADSAFRAPDGRLVQRLPGGFVRDEPSRARLSNYAGTLAMTNLGRPDSGGSQFVINLGHNRWADAWERESPAAHAVFGKLVRRDDLDVATKAARGEVEDDDRPRDPIKVVRARMGTTEDLERAAAAAKEKLLEDAKRGAKGSQFVYGNWD